MVTKRNLCAVLLTVVGFMALQSCYRGWESQPSFEPNPAWQTEGARYIVGPNIRIFMKVSNSRTQFYDNTQKNYFGVSLWFDPKQPGFTFNPNEVFLVLDSAVKMNPAKINIEFAGANNTTEWECGNYPKKDFGLGPSYNLFRGACFDLHFSTKPPSPDTPFSMYIEGLSLDGKPVKVPEIRFHKGSFRVFDFLGK